MLDSSKFEVRELYYDDFDLLLDYWYHSSPKHFLKMGADKSKLPPRSEFKSMLKKQSSLPIKNRKSFALVWLKNEQPFGHTNLNPMKYGDMGYMHLHVWDPSIRAKGLGSLMIRKSLQLFFDCTKINTLYCQPYAQNLAPNRTLQKVGFQFVKKYSCTPGSLNFHQEVNLWKMEKEDFLELMVKI